MTPGFAGFEHALTKNLTTKAEYTHYELSQKGGAYHPSRTQFGPIPVTMEHSGNTIQIGVNYRFIFDLVFAQAALTLIFAKY